MLGADGVGDAVLRQDLQDRAVAGLGKPPHHGVRLLDVHRAAERLDPVGDMGVGLVLAADGADDGLAADDDGEVAVLRGEDALPVRDVGRDGRALQVAEHEVAPAPRGPVDLLHLHRGGRDVGKGGGLPAAPHRLLQFGDGAAGPGQQIGEFDGQGGRVVSFDSGVEGAGNLSRRGVRREAEVRCEQRVEMRAVELAGGLEPGHFVVVPEDAREDVLVVDDVGPFVLPELRRRRLEGPERGIHDLAAGGRQPEHRAEAAGAVAAHEEVRRVVVQDAEDLFGIGLVEVRVRADGQVLEEERLVAPRGLRKHERAAGVRLGGGVVRPPVHDVGGEAGVPLGEPIHQGEAGAEVLDAPGEASAVPEEPVRLAPVVEDGGERVRVGDVRRGPVERERLEEVRHLGRMVAGRKRARGAADGLEGGAFAGLGEEGADEPGLDFRERVDFRVGRKQPERFHGEGCPGPVDVFGENLGPHVRTREERVDAPVQAGARADGEEQGDVLDRVAVVGTELLLAGQHFVRNVPDRFRDVPHLGLDLIRRCVVDEQALQRIQVDLPPRLLGDPGDVDGLEVLEAEEALLDFVGRLRRKPERVHLVETARHFGDGFVRQVHERRLKILVRGERFLALEDVRNKLNGL